jgi:hypothetical protein
VARPVSAAEARTGDAVYHTELSLQRYGSGAGARHCGRPRPVVCARVLVACAVPVG